MSVIYQYSLSRRGRKELFSYVFFITTFNVKFSIFSRNTSKGPDKSLKGTIGNWEVPSLHEGSLEITFTVPLFLIFVGPVPGGYHPSEVDRSPRPMTIDIQGQQGYYGGYDRGNQGGPQLPPTQRVVRFEDTSRQYTQVRQIIQSDDTY